MTQSSSKDNKPAKTNDPKVADAYNRTIGPPDLARLRADFEGMKLIPWGAIWKSLSFRLTPSVISLRGRGRGAVALRSQEIDKQAGYSNQQGSEAVRHRITAPKGRATLGVAVDG